MTYTCPVCGYDRLASPPETPQDGTAPSYEICPSCGFEFGYDDTEGGETYESYRNKWIAGGCRWWWDNDRPTVWDPVAQLKRIGIDLRR